MRINRHNIPTITIRPGATFSPDKAMQNAETQNNIPGRIAALKAHTARIQGEEEILRSKGKRPWQINASTADRMLRG